MHTLEIAELFEEITRAISEHVTFENEIRDSTDGIFDVLGEIVDSVHEDFEELVGITSDKKHFMRALTKIFTLLLNTKVDTVEKIKKNTSYRYRHMARTKATVRRMPIIVLGYKKFHLNAEEFKLLKLKKYCQKRKQFWLKKRTDNQRNEC